MKADHPIAVPQADSVRPGGSAGAGVGRKRDHRLDPLLLAVTIDVLADVGYDRMTITMVADRAGAGRASVYRRWPSKAGLVIEAIRRSSRACVDPDRLPDTGTLRGDLLALFEPHSIAEGERIIKAMAAVAYVLVDGGLDSGVTTGLAADPWAAAHERLIVRAVERGEYRRPVDIAAMSQVVPAAVTYRAIVSRRTVDMPFLTSVIDDVLLPALERGRGDRSP